MASRALLLTATTVLTASLAAAADTPKASPSPKPSPRARSLAEVAREKKAASPAAKTSPSPEPSPGRVFTNEDLPAQPSPPAIASPGPAGTGRGTVTKLPPSAAGAPPPSSESSRSSSSRSSDVPVARERETAEQESGWRGRAAAFRDAISHAEKSIPEIEDRIAGLRNDRSPTNVMDPNREQNRQSEITKAQAELDSVRAGLERSRQALADLEEEARRKGIPPGWIR